MYYETHKLQTRVGPILIPQWSIIYNFIFLLIDLIIRIFESLKRSPFISLAVLIVSQHFFALKFKLNCLKKKCFLQWSVFILLKKFGSNTIYNSTLISFEEKKCILKRSLFLFLQFQFYQRSSSLWTTRVWRSSGYVPLPVGCPTWPEVWTVNSVSAMIRNSQVIHLFFLFYISWSLLFMPFVFN